jgi:predicted ATPase
LENFIRTPAEVFSNVSIALKFSWTLIPAASRCGRKANGSIRYRRSPYRRNGEGADDLLLYGGVRLFVERLRAAEPHFAPDRRRAAMIAAICRRLDGILLAIELAAARAAVLGVEAVTTHLDNRFRILTGGRRTALPRHRTLRATLDWSYELLSEPERVILRRLAVFAGVFRLEAASAVIASPEIAPAEVVDGIANLVAKSLVTLVAGGTVARYRLLDTMRAYGLEKLAESGEREWLARRHAEYYRDLFERAEAEWETRPTAAWPAEYAAEIDNLRAALDWAFSPDGDAQIGVALTAAAVPAWMQLSLMEECRGRVEEALAVLATIAEPDARQEMKLLAALGASRLYIPEAVSPKWPRPGRRPWSLRMALATRSTRSALSGACGPFMSMVWIIAPLCRWRTGSLPWRRLASTRTIDLSANE